MILTDPVYLEEPLIQTTNYVTNDHTQLTFYPCTVTEENISTAFPHFLPGTTEHLEGCERLSSRGRRARRGGDVVSGFPGEN